MTPRTHRFEALDGLRGTAALAVLVYHCAIKLQTPWLMSHGWLAVDLFFVLSGFVVAEAYGEKLAAGMTRRRFGAIRFRRLYPTYLAGTLVGLAGAAAAWAGGRLEVPLSTAVVLSAMAALLAPMFAGPSAAFPLNVPSWSLMIEAGLNAAYALTAKWVGARGLALVSGVAAVALVATAVAGVSLNSGSQAAWLWVGVTRGAFSFSVGLLLHRLHRSGRLARLAGLPTPLLLAVTVAVFAVPFSGFDAPLELGFILLLSPALVAAAVGSRPGPRLARWCAGAALISYPLYALNAPLLNVARRFTPTGEVATPERVWAVLAAAVAALFAAWLLARLEQRFARRGTGVASPAGVQAKLNSGAAASV